MNVATQLDDLQVLGNLLQERLHSEFPHIEDILAQCLIKDDSLLILIQHPADIAVNPEDIFKVLEQAIIANQQEFSSQVKLYVREDGEKRPYAFHRFMMVPQVTENLPSNSIYEIQDPVTKEHNGDSGLVNPFAWDDATEVSAEDSFEDGGIPKAEYLESKSPEFHQEREIANEPTTNPWDEPIIDTDLPPQEIPISQKRERKRLSLPFMVAGIGVGLLFFIGTAYAISRPCVIGGCTTLSNAQKLNAQSTQTLQNPRTVNEILEAQKQLNQAIVNLETIPFWSSYYQQSQTLLNSYQAKASKLNQVTTALSTANVAAKKSQNPPHSAAQWLEIQRLWRETIQQLEQVPKDSSIYPLAQQKQKGYKRNLGIVNQRLNAEQKAKRNLDAAKNASKMAEARSGVAESLESWQLVYASWQMAVKRLNEIPLGTTAYDEAQQLLKDYQTQLTIVRDRTTQERFAANTYKQSIIIAQQAKTAQINNQWSQSVVNWNNALNYAKQVPYGTFYYNKAQPLVNSYTDALKQAQIQLQLATIVQQARGDLNQTCSGSPQICTYTITSNVIKVRLTPAYMKTVQQTALRAKIRGDYNTQAGIYNHVSTVGEALKAISNNVKIRLEIYTPDGVLRETHIPGY